MTSGKVMKVDRYHTLIPFAVRGVGSPTAEYA
jgi:hypothetical protein